MNEGDGAGATTEAPTLGESPMSPVNREQWATMIWSSGEDSPWWIDVHLLASKGDPEYISIRDRVYRAVDIVMAHIGDAAHDFGPWAHLYTVEAMREPGFIPTFCQGCGIPVSPDGFAPQHCQYCPPWDCADCGGKSSVLSPCSCWASLEGMQVADVKALFATDGTFSIDVKAVSIPVESARGAMAEQEKLYQLLSDADCFDGEDRAEMLDLIPRLTEALRKALDSGSADERLDGA